MGRENVSLSKRDGFRDYGLRKEREKAFLA
jgi:hypothetical protein